MDLTAVHCTRWIRLLTRVEAAWPTGIRAATPPGGGAQVDGTEQKDPLPDADEFKAVKGKRDMLDESPGGD